MYCISLGTADSDTSKNHMQSVHEVIAGLTLGRNRLKKQHRAATVCSTSGTAVQQVGQITQATLLLTELTPCLLLACIQSEQGRKSAAVF